jgi:hypothetical protein
MKNARIAQPAFLANFLLRRRIWACQLRCAWSGSSTYCRVCLRGPRMLTYLHLARSAKRHTRLRRLATKTGEKCGLVCPRIRRRRAHGACEASSRREEEAMSRHIVDDEQRRNRPQPPCGWAASGPRSLWVPADLGPLAAQPRGHLRR